jgi:hypothetical protein
MRSKGGGSFGPTPKADLCLFVLSQAAKVTNVKSATLKFPDLNKKLFPSDLVDQFQLELLCGFCVKRIEKKKRI